MGKELTLLYTSIYYSSDIFRIGILAAVTFPFFYLFADNLGIISNLLSSFLKVAAKDSYSIFLGELRTAVVLIYFSQFKKA